MSGNGAPSSQCFRPDPVESKGCQVKFPGCSFPRGQLDPYLHVAIVHAGGNGANDVIRRDDTNTVHSGVDAK